MWNPKIVDSADLSDFDPIEIINGSKSALIVKNFYDKEDCSELASRIISRPDLRSPGMIKAIGPFLMQYATRKAAYLEQSMVYDKIFLELFSNLENPVVKIKNFLSSLFPKFSFEFASENDQKYSKCVIRIHEDNDDAPVHKDNVSYEGKNYAISNIDYQISSVLHLQEAHQGGDITIYKKQWSKNDETHRKIAFGYDEKFLDCVEQSKISPNQGDLVIINPNYFHGVGKVSGTRKRITLGMFAGFYNNKRKTVLWA